MPIVQSSQTKLQWILVREKRRWTADSVGNSGRYKRKALRIEPASPPVPALKRGRHVFLSILMGPLA